MAGLAPYEKRIGELLKVRKMGRDARAVFVCERGKRMMNKTVTQNRRPFPPPPFPQTGREKRALKFTKRKLGTHKRGKAKRDEVADILRKKK